MANQFHSTAFHLHDLLFPNLSFKCELSLVPVARQDFQTPSIQASSFSVSILISPWLKLNYYSPYGKKINQPISCYMLILKY